jgi:hypothetical protein
MACDTLVERITGRPAEVPVPVAVNLVLTDTSLLAGSKLPGRVTGYGPIPAMIARRLIGSAVGDRRSRATLRRLYKHPRSGALLTMESRARTFPKGLADFIDLRDDTCRTPYCDAPIRHHDHATTDARGGATTVDDTGCHHAEFPTPTGARHHSKAPPLPGPIRIDISDVETLIGIALAKHAA